MPAKITQVYTLRIETISPVAILSGARLREEVDFFVNQETKTTCVINSDAALELALARWLERQPSPEERRRQLEQRAEKIRRWKERHKAEIKQFEQSPPRDPRKQVQQEERLRDEARKIKQAERELREEQQLLALSGDVSPTVPDQLLSNSGFGDLIKSGLLSDADLSPDSRLTRYYYAGQPASQSGQSEILACVKDAFGRLYIPGSSLKGALRTILSWALAPENAGNALTQFASEADKRQAARPIERAIFYGRKQGDDRRVSHELLRDVMRVVHIGDSRPLRQMPELLNVQVFPQGSPIAVEAIPAGLTFTATLQIDLYPLTSPVARAIIDFGNWTDLLQPAALAAGGRRRARQLIEGEKEYFKNRGAPALSQFYQELEKQLEQLDQTNSFLIPIGWGAGWRTKTLDDRLRADQQREQVFVEAVHRYRMKIDEQRSRRFQAGDLFPATRKLVMRGKHPYLPLGWMRITIEERG
ncbi:type III-A CRISPR-associated RAMP protein Csm5 [Chloroflexus sp.]|uniref:type III-A CRISPR-associated RAMP protein Csm5 n=1 Tax=Chloroflexus sp. TaxID=1904827 RepID=UPI0026033CE9|nr:type III-A CRISPR-associated RAMP protein Csm5 [uncultured Chloroflexus sp.]